MHDSAHVHTDSAVKKGSESSCWTLGTDFVNTPSGFGFKVESFLGCQVLDFRLRVLLVSGSLWQNIIRNECRTLTTFMLILLPELLPSDTSTFGVSHV